MDAESLLIVCSGTHGNEGVCGSGRQIGLIAEGVIGARPQTSAVLLLHAVSPYGFSAVSRRVCRGRGHFNRARIRHARTRRSAGGDPGRQLALRSRNSLGARHGVAARPRHQGEHPRRADHRHPRLEGPGFHPRRRFCAESPSRSCRPERCAFGKIDQAGYVGQRFPATALFGLSRLIAPRFAIERADALPPRSREEAAIRADAHVTGGGLVIGSGERR